MALTKSEIIKRKQLFEQGLKICGKCKEVLSVECFTKNKNYTDGLSTRCKKCTSIGFKKYYEEHTEYMREKTRKYVANNPEKIKEYYDTHKEERRVYDSKYKKNNAEKINQQRKNKGYDKLYYQKHREKLMKKQKAYYEAHKEQRRQWLRSEAGRASERASRHKRRALILKNGGIFTKEEVFEALAFFDYKCAYTGEPLEDSYNLDHIVALTKGGTNYIWNIVPCNKSPNSSKNNSEMEEWYRKQPYFLEERLQKIYEWINLQKSIKGENNNE